MKRKLLVFVGAGASIELGFPSSKKIGQDFIDWAQREYGMFGNGTDNLYSFIQNQLKKYYNGLAKPGIVRTVYFEEVLFLLTHLYALINDTDYQTLLASIVQTIPIPTLDSGQQVSRAHIGNMTSELVDKLLETIRGHCAKIKTVHRTELSIIADFLSQINSEYDIGVISLNYDNAIYQAWPAKWTTGFNDAGDFNPELVWSSAWNYYFQLHGSVHFDMQNRGSGLHEIVWQEDLTARFESGSLGRNRRQTREGLHHLTSQIVVGYDKANQLQIEPFHTYYCELNRLLHKADSILFLGYGFGDQHVNGIFEFIRTYSPPKPIVVITFAKDTEDPLQIRRDEWGWSLINTLSINPTSMGDGMQSSMVYIGDLKATNSFEASNDPRTPLRVWYNGFIEACRHPQAIIDNLI